MTAILPPPPRHWLTKTRIPAWLRFGKIAIVSVLAVLVIAGGLAFPDAEQAEAQSVRGGYTYTERICQEYGRQPQRYQVRDPIAGSDWRNDGGWAIIVERGGGSSNAVTVTFSTITGGGVWTAGLVNDYNGGILTSDDDVVGFINPSQSFPPARVGNRLIENGQLAIDRNGNGVLDSGDATYSGNQLEVRDWNRTTTTVIGGSYIRWANMWWCR